MKEQVTEEIEFRKVIPEYENAYPLEMAILRIGGIYPSGKPEAIVNPYTRQEETEYFGNVGEHSLAVAKAADILSTKVFGENASEKRNIVRRALVHDATKRFEVMRRNAVKAGLFEGNAYAPSAYDSIKPQLVSQQVSPDIVEYMAKAGSETGHNSIPAFLELKDGKPALRTENNLPEMIVHLADDMTFTPFSKPGEAAPTSFVTVEERMKAADFPTKYPFLYTEGYGFDAAGNVVTVKDITHPDAALTHVRSMADWQIWTAKEISHHLAAKIDPEQFKSGTSPEKAEAFLKTIINESL